MLDEIDPDLRPYLVPFLEWVDDDWTDCCFLSGPMVRAGYDPQETKRTALEVLRYAFGRGWVVAGHLPRRFEPWDGSPSDWLVRLESEWPNDRVPEMGEVAWFDLADGAHPAIATLLDCARSEGTPLLSLDGGQRAAAERIGIPLHPF